MKPKTYQAVLNAFTLIELLVVIAIIALLMSIILPSMNLAKKAARKTVCASQMRQISIAFQTYAADWDDWIITAKDIRNTAQGQKAWNFALLPYISKRDDSVSFENTAELWFCPEDKDPYPLGYGAYPHGVPFTSYALNGCYEPRTNIKLGPAGGFKSYQIRTASDCMLMVETCCSCQIYDKDHPNVADKGLTSRGHHRRTSGFYHNDSMNIIFVDGHVNNIKGRKARPYMIGISQDWSGSNMFWPDLTLPSATEEPQLWGPGY